MKAFFGAKWREIHFARAEIPLYTALFSEIFRDIPRYNSELFRVMASYFAFHTDALRAVWLAFNPIELRLRRRLALGFGFFRSKLIGFSIFQLTHRLHFR